MIFKKLMRFIRAQFAISTSQYVFVANRNTQDQFPTFKLNLKKGEAKRKTFEGNDFLVVPVVMLRDTVVNGSRVTVDELEPFAWNGVPVTMNHPTDSSGDFISANSPQTLEKFQIGHVFNSHLDGDKLKAQAWLNIEKTEKVRPGFIAQLESGTDIVEVSTGYFCDQENKTGVFNGKEFNNVQTNLRPDHFALLPDSVGACSVKDGCGIRANKSNDDLQSTILKVLNTAVDSTLKKLSITPLEESNENTEDVKNVSEKCECETLTDEDKAALEFARNSYKRTRKALTSQLIDNTNYTEEDLEGFEVDQLQVMVNRLSTKEESENDDSENEEGESQDESGENEEENKDKEVEANKSKKKADFSGRGKPGNSNKKKEDRYAMNVATSIGVLKTKTKEDA